MTLPDAAQLWSGLPVATLLIDGENRIKAANTAAEDLLNISSKALIGKDIWTKLQVDAPLERGLARTREQSAAMALLDVTIHVGARPAMTVDMHMSALSGTAGDVLIQAYPRQIADRLLRGHSAKTAARAAIGMAEMLAHEIKNPLAGITGAAQLLGMNLAGEDLDLTDLIVKESRRIVKLLEQVEQFGNLSAPARKRANIHDILDRARRSAMVGFAAHMEILEDYDPSLPATLVDPDQFVQVFLNLLKNAAEVGQAGGKITLRTFYDHSLRLRKGDGARAPLPLQVEVIDNGPGIPADIAEEIFEPFVSGRENGTGLGLALVSKIVSDNDGWIAVTSEPGRTVFRLSLPVAPKDGAA